MRFDIQRSAMMRVMGHVQPVVERRNTIPILSNVLISAEAGVIEFSATDLDIQVRERVEVDVERPGRTTVSAGLLNDIVRKMPDGGVISVSVDGHMMTVSSGRARFRLPVLPAEDFPNLQVGDMQASFEIPAKQLSAILTDVRFAISTEETRYYLNGVFLHLTAEDGGRMKAAATDGHRLSLVSAPLPEGIGDMPSVIVPRKCVAELVRAVETEDGDVAISVSRGKVLFDFGARTYLSKTIDGTFPEYARVIPSTNANVLEIDPAALMQGVDRVTTIATERTRAVKLALEADRVVLTVNSPEHGNAVEEVACSYDGKPIEIGFNARYLLDILQRMRGDSVRVELGDASAPAVFRKAPDDESLCVLMPMRV